MKNGGFFTFTCHSGAKQSEAIESREFMKQRDPISRLRFFQDDKKTKRKIPSTLKEKILFSPKKTFKGFLPSFEMTKRREELVSSKLGVVFTHNKEHVLLDNIKYNKNF